MMTKRLITAMLAVTMVAAVPGIAHAQEDPAAAGSQPARDAGQVTGRQEPPASTVDEIKTRALEAIERRLVTLAELETRIDESDTVKANHAAALMQDVRFSVKGLEDLAEEIRAATEVETLRELVPQIFEDYRVYAVVVPKAHLTLNADAAAAIADRLADLTDAIAGLLDRLQEAGFDVTPAEGLLDEMIRLIESGATGAEAVPDMVLDLAPADYPGSTEVLRSAHQTLQGVGSDLRAAGDTAHAIGRYVKSLFGGTGQ